MKKLQISAEHRLLIESVIKESPKYKGHEELIDIFCDSIYRKSYLLIDAIKDMSRLRRHLLMICDSCMDQIISEKKKYDEIKLYKEISKNAPKEDIVSLKRNHPLYDAEAETETTTKTKIANVEIVNLKEEIQRSEKYNATDNLIDPLDFCPQKRVSEATVEKLLQIVKAVDARFPKKKYFTIFSMRYIKHYNQTEIARSLKISQVELSKRFVEMVKLAKEYA